MYASKPRTEKFAGPGENCQRNVTDLAGSLVTSCRPPGRLQNTPDDRTWNAGVAVRTADGSRLFVPQMLATSNVWGVDAAVCHVLWSGVTCHPADAGDEQCLRCGCSSPSCAVVLCAGKEAAKRVSSSVVVYLCRIERLELRKEKFREWRRRVTDRQTDRETCRQTRAGTRAICFQYPSPVTS